MLRVLMAICLIAALLLIVIWLDGGQHALFRVLFIACLGALIGLLSGSPDIFN